MALPLTARAFAGLAFLALAMALAVFVPAGAVDWWQGWVLLGVLVGSMLAITLWLLRTDRPLLERRTVIAVAAEQRNTQKVIQGILQLAFLGLFIVSGLDRRFEWSRVPAWVAAAGDVLVVAAMSVIFLVLRENSFAAFTVEVGKEQRVVSTGPYAVVRHPMYAGALPITVGIPLALGSWWGLLGAVPMTAGIVWRLLDEERVLVKELRGYGEYREKVRWRLIPGVF